jgi:hypothetical protein
MTVSMLCKANKPHAVTTEEKYLIKNTLSQALIDHIDNVAALLMPQEVNNSAVGYSRTSTEPVNTVCGQPGESGFVTMQIDFWADDYQTAVDMYEAGKVALEGLGRILFTVRRKDFV